MWLPGFLYHVNGQWPQHFLHHCQMLFTVMRLKGASCFRVTMCSKKKGIQAETDNGMCYVAEAIVRILTRIFCSQT